MNGIRILQALAFTGLVVGAACGIDDLLIGAPCNENADCPSLSCVQTASELANGSPGRCSDNGECVPGEQEGCLASDGCSSGLTPVSHTDGNTYCCSIGTNTMVVGIAEDGTAECASCESCSFDEEPCLAGEDRCVVEAGAACGCRLPEGDLLNEACDGDEACGSLVCVRTLEQQEEPLEATLPDQEIEDGNCRPSDEPTCAPGQRGCLVPTGTGCLSNSDTVVADGTLEFCCPPSPDTNNFVVRLYDVSSDQQQAACTFCERRVCTSQDGNPNTVDQCTSVSDPGCNVPAGELCGCPPT